MMDVDVGAEFSPKVTRYVEAPVDSLQENWRVLVTCEVTVTSAGAAGAVRGVGAHCLLLLM